MYLHVKIGLICIAIAIGITGLFYLRPQLERLTAFGKSVKDAKEMVLPPTEEVREKSTPAAAAAPLQPPVEQTLKKTTPAAPPHFAEKLQLANDLFKKDDLVKARKIAENLLLDPKLAEFSPEWYSAAALISAINSVFLFTDAPCPEKVIYSVASGDNLISIANRFNTTVSLIQRSNGLDETNPMIYPNQTFRIYQAKWQLRASKSRFALILQDGDRLIKLYKVGIGRQDRTPVGTFEVDLKDFEPDWWRPGEVIKFGDPRNVLGTRWLGLVATGDTDSSLRGYGIHGTSAPNSIGTAASQGCIRMVNAQVEELFDIVPVGTKVTIEE